jgi:hypothetical protein
MSRTKCLALALGIAVLMLGALGASAARLKEEFNRTVPAKPGDRVVVDNANGSVTVEAWDRDEVRIQATRYVEAGSRKAAEDAMAELKIEVNVSDGRVEVRTVAPRRPGSSSFWGWMTGGNENTGVTYRVTVPRSANLDVGTVNGRVVVRDVSGEMKLGSTNGKIEVRGGSGRVDASTTNGGIYAQLRSASGGMRFSTTNGSVELELPGSIAANVDVATTNGSIKTDFPVTVSGTFSRNRLSGEVNGGGELLKVRTTNGSVRISKANG